MKLTLDKSQSGIAAIAVGGAALTIAAVVAFMSASAPPELAVTPTDDCDTGWLTTATPDISYSAGQVRRFIDNRDRSLCNGQSMLGAITSLMAQKYLASAITDTNNPKHPCSKGTVTQCLATYGDNIVKDLDSSKQYDRTAAALQKLIALTYAVEAYSTGKNIPNVTGPSTNMAKVLIDNLTKRDAKEAAQAGLESQAQDIRKERAEAEKDAEELDKNIIELK